MYFLINIPIISEYNRPNGKKKTFDLDDKSLLDIETHLLIRVKMCREHCVTKTQCLVRDFFKISEN